MRIPKRAVAALVAVAAIAIASMAIAVSTSGADPGSQGNHGNQDGHGNGAPLLRASLAPSQPPPTDPPIHGVPAGGAPWVLQRGDVRLKRDGQLDLRVQGLVIPSMGSPGPVTGIRASLFCGADSNTTPAATTQTVPISRTGDARIRDTITVPPTCLAPVILVQPTLGQAGPANVYIAVTGWRS